MPPTPRPFTVAIAGGSGSGKTTLASTTASLLGSEQCVVLDHDSYYRDLSHLPPADRANANFDHPDILDSSQLAHHLAELRREAGGKCAARLAT